MLLISSFLSFICFAVADGDHVSARRQARSRAIQLESQFKLTDSIDSRVLASQVRKEFDAHKDLLEQLETRDIVAFLGNTGAGKSTLINFLAYGTERMEIASNGDVVLVNPDDPTAMAIGCGGVSETIYPKAIQVGDFWLYDLPGFNDTQGTVRNLMNAAFIRQILTKARSVRLVIAFGEDEVTASRGVSFKGMLESVKKLFKVTQDNVAEVLRHHSVLVLTKSTNTALDVSGCHVLRKSADEYHGLLRAWIDNKRFGHMCHARTTGADWEAERAAIFSLIQNSMVGHFQESESGKSMIDISAIYPMDTIRILEKMFGIIMQEKLDKHLERISKVSDLDDAIDSLTPAARGAFWQKIDEEVSSVEEVRLLKVFCETPYSAARSKFGHETSKILSAKKNKRIKELETRCSSLIEEALKNYHRAHKEETPIASAVNHEFHRFIYDAIFGLDILDQITGGDLKEKAVLIKRWEAFMGEYRTKQIAAYTERYDHAKAYAISGT